MPSCRSSATAPFAPRSALGHWVLLAALLLTGCSGYQWQQLGSYPSAAPLGPSDVLAAQVTLTQAQDLDRDGQATAVDLYYLAAVQAQSGLLQFVPLPDPAAPETAQNLSATVYRQALAGLIDAGQRYGRLDPRRQLMVLDGGTRVIPISYRGFAWRPEEFSRLSPTKNLETKEIAHHYQCPGVGLTLIGARVACCSPETFFAPWQPFAVTAVLRPAADSSAANCGGQVLELYNPLAYDTIDWNGARLPLARDLTAPLSAIVKEVPRQYLRGFTAPSDTSVKPQLLLLEPYQRGKIPVVFIHGLYSDPITWADMINDLRVAPGLYDQFQFWTYRYPTGGELLESAAVLRERLQLVRNTFDPQHTDPALDNMVLVGHSLGGLVSQMQITTSYDILWREMALQPFGALRASPELQQRLAREFFYGPVPMVKRVIFIGTPHNGSGVARQCAGRISNDLIRFGSEEDEQYRQLIDQNRDVFRPIVQSRRPTTIDLLDPDSPFLQGLAQMPISCSMHLHSIIGTGGLIGDPGDGVVSITSARHCGESELFVPAKHEKLHRDPASIDEVVRILRLHAAAADQAVAASPSTSPH